VNTKRVRAALALAGAALLFVVVGARGLLRRPSNEPFFSSASPAAHMAMVISSGSFPNGGYIPKQFTCDGTDISPELSWTNPPPGAQSFALIAEDPDAPVGTWTHWVVFDLPPSTRSLPEGVGKMIDKLPDGGRQGANDFGKTGYGGPCPPPGKPHRYFFKLYAAIEHHVLDEAEWMGRYRR
jgi:Raf kinase inhibitor-like YbhB/YbcL family protein